MLSVEKINKLEQENAELKACLQEIKAIVCSNGEIIDTQGRKDIIKLITKAEVNNDK